MSTDLYATARRETEFTAEELVELARGSHMWLNAFSIIRPTDETLIAIGRWVLNELRESPIRDDLIGRTPIAYLRVNSS